MHQRHPPWDMGPQFCLLHLLKKNREVCVLPASMAQKLLSFFTQFVGLAPKSWDLNKNIYGSLVLSFILVWITLFWFLLQIHSQTGFSPWSNPAISSGSSPTSCVHPAPNLPASSALLRLSCALRGEYPGGCPSGRRCTDYGPSFMFPCVHPVVNKPQGKWMETPCIAFWAL